MDKNQTHQANPSESYFVEFREGDLITQEFVETYRDKIVPWGFNGLGYIVYKRTYARFIPQIKRKEEWPETIARAVNGAVRLGTPYTQAEAEKLFDMMFYLKCSVSGRGLWQLGTKTVENIGADSLLNCFGGKTRVLTNQGWRNIENISGRKVKVLTKNGVFVDSEIKHHGKQELYEVEIMLPNGEIKNIQSTGMHNWIIVDADGEFQKRSTTTDLNPDDKLPLTRTEIPVADTFDSKTMNKDAFLKGVCLAVGRDDNDGVILEYLPDSLVEELKSLGIDPHEKQGLFYNSTNSEDIKWHDTNYLFSLIEGFESANGGKLTSTRNEVAELLQDILSVLGYAYSVYGNGLREISKIHCGAKYCQVVSAKKIDGEAQDVYCAEVPETHCFVIDGNILTGNCWVTKISTVEDFCFIFMESMLGGGVGCVISREYTGELPRVKKGVQCRLKNTADADFIVPDSKEGWCDLWRRILEAYLHTGKSFTYSTIVVRKKGEPIKTFGGVAPGDGPLIEGAEILVKILENREGEKLRTADVADIITTGGQVVKSGGVRRCLAEGTLVQTSSGVRPIEDVTKNYKVMTANGYRPVLDSVSQGNQECVKLVHGLGEIVCTPNHRIAVLDRTEEFVGYKWVEASDIKSEDKMLLPIDNTSMDVPRSGSNSVGQSLAWCFGFIVNSMILVEDSYKICIDIGHEKYCDRLMESLKDFGIKEKQIKKSKVKRRSNCQIIITIDRNFIDQIRPSITNLTYEDFVAWTAGLFDYIHCQPFYNFEISHEMLLTIQQDLLKNGIVVGIKEESDLAGHKGYIVSISEDEYKKHGFSKFCVEEPWKVINNKSYREITSSLYEVDYLETVPAGPKETYDITVEDEACFVANSILVHNTALILMGDADDAGYMKLKRWDLGNIPNHRANSNNSILADRFEDIDHRFWDGYKVDHKTGFAKGEPYGLVNIRNARRFGRIGETKVGDYKLVDNSIIGANPCVTGDTKVYVADGRGYVDFKTLAQEDVDVPVFCLDNNDKIQVRTMRHPKVTAENVPVYKVTMDDGSVIKATLHHKFVMKDGTVKTTGELIAGDSLKTVRRQLLSFEEVNKKSNSRSQKYAWLSVDDSNTKVMEHRVVASHFHNDSKFIKSGLVVHHRDYNALNNAPENLEIMTKQAHDELHSKDMIGDKNPMRRAATEWSDEKWADYRAKQSALSSGEGNCKYSGFTHEQVFEHAIILTKKLGKRVVIDEWVEYATPLNLPVKFSRFRTEGLGTVNEMMIRAAIQCGIGKEEAEADGRTATVLNKMLEMGYDAWIEDGQCFVKKTCEQCGNDFDAQHLHRERGYCSTKCGNKFINSDPAILKTRADGVRKAYDAMKPAKQLVQIKALDNYLNSYGCYPTTRKEFESMCKEAGISAEIGRKSSPFMNVHEAVAAHKESLVAVEV